MSAADPRERPAAAEDERRRAHLAAFLAEGSVATAEHEVVRLSGAALELHERLVAGFRALGRASGAERREYPVLLPTALLARTGYFLSFPHQATFAAPVEPAEVGSLVDALERGEPLSNALRGRAAVPERILSPAVCYHCYAELAGGRLQGPLRMIQATGRCFRHEDAAARLPLARQREFTMHELVLLGEQQAVADARDSLCRRVVAMATRAGLTTAVVPAQDPFYGSVQGRALGMMQRVSGSKLELVVEVGDGPLAIASFNLHGDYFGHTLEIAGTDRGVLFSGCVAFGIERWICALVATHGPEPAAWKRALAELEDA